MPVLAQGYSCMKVDLFKGGAYSRACMPGLAATPCRDRVCMAPRCRGLPSVRALACAAALDWELMKNRMDAQDSPTL